MQVAKVIGRFSGQLSVSIGQVAPKSLRDFGGIDLSMGWTFSPGGRSDRLIGPEGQLGLLDRMGQPKADWYIHICM